MNAGRKLALIFFYLDFTFINPNERIAILMDFVALNTNLFFCFFFDFPIWNFPAFPFSFFGFVYFRFFFKLLCIIFAFGPFYQFFTDFTNLKSFWIEISIVDTCFNSIPGKSYRVAA